MTKKYKTPEKLGLSFAEYGALLGVRAMLSSHVIKHQAGPKKDGEIYFDMNHWSQQRCSVNEVHCGTAACIGGSMELILGGSNNDLTDVARTALYALFFPDHSDTATLKQLSMLSNDWAKITTKQAIEAIDNFLYTGHARWERVLSV